MQGNAQDITEKFNKAYKNWLRGRGNLTVGRDCQRNVKTKTHTWDKFILNIM